MKSKTKFLIIESIKYLLNSLYVLKVHKINQYIYGMKSRFISERISLGVDNRNEKVMLGYMLISRSIERYRLY